LTINNIVYIIAPHPDDETLACGGTIKKLIRNGHIVKWIIVCKGEKSHQITFPHESEPTIDFLIQQRKTECIDAAKTLGVLTENITFLNYEDLSAEEKFTEIKSKIYSIIKKDICWVTKLYFPHPRDKHTDHKAVGKLMFNLAAEHKWDATIMMYKIYKRNYTKLPPEWYVIEDIGNDLDTKIKAIQNYESQTSLWMPYQDKTIIPKKLLNFFITSEMEIFYKI